MKNDTNKIYTLDVESNPYIRKVSSVVEGNNVVDVSGSKVSSVNLEAKDAGRQVKTISAESYTKENNHALKTQLAYQRKDNTLTFMSYGDFLKYIDTKTDKLDLYKTFTAVRYCFATKDGNYHSNYSLRDMLAKSNLVLGTDFDPNLSRHYPAHLVILEGYQGEELNQVVNYASAVTLIEPDNNSRQVRSLTESLDVVESLDAEIVIEGSNEEQTETEQSEHIQVEETTTAEVESDVDSNELATTKIEGFYLTDEELSDLALTKTSNAKRIEVLAKFGITEVAGLKKPQLMELITEANEKAKASFAEQAEHTDSDTEDTE